MKKNIEKEIGSKAEELYFVFILFVSSGHNRTFRKIIKRELGVKIKELFLRILLLFSCRDISGIKSIFPNMCPLCKDERWMLEQGSFRLLGVFPIDHHVVTWSLRRCKKCGHVKGQSVLFRKEHAKQMEAKSIISN